MSSGILLQIQKVNLELFRLSAYYIPLVLDDSLGSQGHDSENSFVFVGSKIDQKQLMQRISLLAFKTREMNVAMFTDLFNIFTSADAQSAEYLSKLIETQQRTTQC